MEHSPLTAFALALACAAAATALIGWQALLGFALGVAITLVVGTICAADLD
jgi:hypothetical protein